MKKYNIRQLAVAFFAVFSFSACTDEFAEINTDPNIVKDAELDHLLTFAEKQLRDVGHMWFWDNHHYYMTWTQHSVPQGGNSDEFVTINNLIGQKSLLYKSLMPNLMEIREQIDNMPDESKIKRERMRAITYPILIYQAIKVTDMYGDIPYLEAGRGRYEQLLNPKYDKQSDLYDIWISELNTVIKTLTEDITDAEGNVVEQSVYGSKGKAEIIYSSDWAKWAKFANTLKLRLAIRLTHADPTRAKTIAEEALSNSAGIFEGPADEFRRLPKTDDRGPDNEMHYTTPHGAYEFMKFMCDTQDPRTKNYFEPNGFTDEVVQKFESSATATLPDIIKNAPTEMHRRYIGLPVSPDKVDDDAYAQFFTPVKLDGDNSYRTASRLHYRYFHPAKRSGNGYYIYMYYSYGEMCFNIAELIERLGINGDAEEWYNKGVRASLEMVDMLASAAQVEQHEDLTETEITDYLAMPQVAYTGDKDTKLEKIAIQQQINFFRDPFQSFVYSRRTGFPKKGSDLLPWEPFILENGTKARLPRRISLGDPGEFNRTNWEQAMSAQGFTPMTNNILLLNTERMWIDENSPEFGHETFD
ncbi:hypothetical protein FUAX_31940 [Fulvitalea axinellae]|uniref:SusD/RagB family nutrient-binding outer membrane lipoprotein n=1 Tax=Fulvitalea axinellae TaxID=1182444 RepID=A0AAU9CZ72_9BACT|nr:hypothetical protein FUAX_31940 [Fulvitalea axinellae]